MLPVKTNSLFLRVSDRTTMATPEDLAGHRLRMRFGSVGFLDSEKFFGFLLPETGNRMFFHGTTVVRPEMDFYDNRLILTFEPVGNETIHKYLPRRATCAALVHADSPDVVVSLVNRDILELMLVAAESFRQQYDAAMGQFPRVALHRVVHVRSAPRANNVTKRFESTVTQSVTTLTLPTRDYAVAERSLSDDNVRGLRLFPPDHLRLEIDGEQPLVTDGMVGINVLRQKLRALHMSAPPQQKAKATARLAKFISLDTLATLFPNDFKAKLSKQSRKPAEPAMA